MTDPVASFRRHRARVLLVMLVLLATVAVVVGFRQFHASSGPTTAVTLRPLSETPGSSAAILFGTADDRLSDMAFIKAQLQSDHYSVDELTSANGRATAAGFKAALLARPGILFVAADGGQDFVSVEKLADATMCAAAVSAYLTSSTFRTGEITCHDRLLGITGLGINDVFRDADTIVYISACASMRLQQSFAQARDFVGYQDCGGAALAPAGDRRFWGRLAGTTDNGRSRSTEVAAGKGGYGAGWQFHHRAQTADTVLAPAVARATPAAGSTFRVVGSTAGQVMFDARMDQSVAATDLLSVSGCATATDPHWVTTATGYSAVDFALQLNAPGTAVMTVHAPSARAARNFHNTLDGNQDPAGTDGVAPNGDDYVWSIGCAGGGGPQVTTMPPSSGAASTTPSLAPATTTSAPPDTAATGAGAGPGAGTGTGTGAGTGGTTAPGGGPSGTGATSSAPTCVASAVQASPPPSRQSATVQASAGLASISGVTVSNGTVSVPHFAVGTTAPVVVVATKADQTMPTQWSFDVTDVVGRTTHCA